jgi:eukaryotic-like serine/threonine-protein kinase
MSGRSYALAAALAIVVGAACGGGRPEAREPAVAEVTTEWIERAHAAERERRYDRARQAYQRAIAGAPDDFSRGHGHRELGRALVFWGEYEAGQEALERAVALRPGDAPAWHDLGIVRHQLGDLTGAEAALTRAAALAPRDPRPRIALAALLWNQERLTEALAQYDALAGLELPEAVREKVEWARSTLRGRLQPR